MPKPFRTLWWPVATVFLLVGCSDDSAEHAWEQYHQQLAAALDTPLPTRSEPRNIGAFPERQQRLIDVPETRDGMLNIYALRECQITSLIAARNNQLGRVAPPSQHWLYERSLWQRLDACWNSDIPNTLGDDDKARLAQLTELKTEQLPAVSWNAIFDSDEWEKSFSRASSPLPPGGADDISEQLAALTYLRQMVNEQFSHRWEQDSSRLENHLKTLQERPLTAEVLRALLLAEQRLREANQLLTQTSDEEACLTVDTPVWIETMATHSQQWLVSVNQLIDAHPITPPDAVATYQRDWLSLDNPEAPWSQFQSTWEAHTALKSAHTTCTPD